jgi:hypothetical protein
LRDAGQAAFRKHLSYANPTGVVDALLAELSSEAKCARPVKPRLRGAEVACKL